MRSHAVPDTCGVWWEVPSRRADLEARASLLSGDERARADRLRRPADRTNFIAAWSLAREVLAQVSDVAPDRLTFSRTCAHCGHPTHGKPFLPGSALDFSLSHAGDRVALAVSERAQVGVDVERRDEPTAGLAPLVLHPDEHARSDQALVRAWVRKEAVLKCTGHGLAVPMPSIHLERLPHTSRVHDIDVGDDYWAAVATVARPA